MSDRSAAAWGLLVVLVVGFVVHRSALDHDFVGWDDDINLYENPNLIHEEIRFALPWVEPYQGMWIPVTYSVWALVAAATREKVAVDRYVLDPGAHHAVNLALHLASSALVLLLLLRWLPKSGGRRRELPAVLGALLFAVHPIQVEAVHWATAMKDTLSVFLALASVACVPLAPSRFGGRLAAAWLLFALALAAKPGVVVVPVVWLLLVATRDGAPRRWSWIHFGVLLGLAATVAGVARVAQPAEPGGTSLGLFERVTVGFDSLGFYLGQIALPGDYCPDYGRTPEWVLAQDGLTGAALAGLGYGAVVVVLALRRRWRAVAVMVAFPVALAPVLGLVPFAHQRFSTVTDRYVYLAMLVPAFVFARALVHAQLGRAWPLGAAFVLLCAALSMRAGPHWQDTQTMWNHVLDVNPRSASAWVNLGHRHDQAGRTDVAIDYYQRSIAADARFSLPHNNIGNIHFRAGRLDEAYAHYSRARDANPRDLHAKNNLGAVHHRRGELARAAELFEEVVSINPHFAPAHHNLGLVAGEQGRWDDAEEHLRAALEIDPGFVAVHRSLTKVLARAGGRDDEARRHLSRGWAREPGDAAFELAWSAQLIEVGRPATDIRAARLEAFRLGHREQDFLAALGRGLLADGELASAEEVLREAVQRAPEDLALRLDLASAFEGQAKWDAYRDLMIRAVRDFPRAAAPWHNLAVYQLEHDRVDQARALVRSALSLHPHFEPSVRLAERLGLVSPQHRTTDSR